MTPGEPDREATPPAPSLAARLLSFRLPQSGFWFPVALGLLIVTGPLATYAGARLLTYSARSEAARAASDLAPRIEARKAADAVRAELGNALARPALGPTLEALARVLPPDAMLLRAERSRAGIELDILTIDPDRLRAAIRRAPEFAGLRDASQRQAEGGMIVSMREAAQ